jgi:hypothetical protein
VPTTPPRYSAPDRSRQRVRLIAAIGLLASTAIAIGGLVGLLSSDDEATIGTPGDAERASEPSSVETLRNPLSALDSIDALILEVERAERAASSARAALRRARVLGTIDTDQLDWLERRLDALGRTSGVPSPAPTAPLMDDGSRSTAARASTSEGPREL